MTDFRALYPCRLMPTIFWPVLVCEVTFCCYLCFSEMINVCHLSISQLCSEIQKAAVEMRLTAQWRLVAQLTLLPVRYVSPSCFKEPQTEPLLGETIVSLPLFPLVLPLYIGVWRNVLRLWQISSLINFAVCDQIIGDSFRNVFSVFF